MRTDDLDFELPPELIAQHPVTPRDSSRLMRYQRATREVSHHVFRDLPELLRRGDLLVFNDAKVLPAKFTLIRPTGGRVGGLFLEEPRAGEWIALLKGLVDRSRHAYWLNPEPRREWGSGDSMAYRYGEIIEMVECRNVAQLTDFVGRLLPV